MICVMDQFIYKIIDRFVFENGHALGENDKAFLNRIYSKGIKIYIDRLKSIGFENKSRVLDAGCGFGQWSLALGNVNSNVFAFDSCKIRTNFLKSSLSELKVSNVLVGNHCMEEMDYQDNFFDNIFCYSSIYRSDWKKTLKNFLRVLKPNGILYICSNGIGWYLYNFLNPHNSVNDFDAKLHAVGSIQKSIPNIFSSSDSNNFDSIICSKTMCSYLSPDCDIIYCGKEGGYSLKGNGNIPFFIGEFEGYEAVYEIVAKKVIN